VAVTPGAPARVPRLEICSADGPDRAAPPDAEVWPVGGGRVLASAYDRAGWHWLELPGLTTFRFDEGGERVAAMPRPGVRPDTVAEAYRHSALPLVLQARGHEALHASAVVAAAGVAIFCGASGSGKSTTAYGLHRRGYGLWSDDVVALEFRAGAIQAIPLPFDVRLRPPSASLFGLGERGARLAAALPAAPRPLVAVCVLDREHGQGAEPVVEPLAPREAFTAVLAHAFCFSLRDRARKRVMLDRYLAVIARVPAYRVGLGAGLPRFASLLDRLERAIGATGTA
jgi:hypothetical protein